mgnify:CR=1 FL=1|jgi:vitamin B12 transporter
MRTALAVISLTVSSTLCVAQVALDSLKTEQLDSVSVSTLALRISPEYTSALLFAQISKSNPSQNMGQMLQRNAGIYIRSNGSSGLNTLSYKGLGSMQSPLVINGANMQSSMNGIMDLSLIDAIHFDQVSIGDSDYDQNGAQNMGSALALKTNSSLPQLKVTAEVSSQQDKILSALYANHTKQWEYRVSALAAESPNRVNLDHYGIDSFQANTDYKKISLMQSVSLHLNQKGSWENTIYLQASDRAMPPRIGEVNFSRQEDLNLMMTNGFSQNLAKKWEVIVHNQLWKEQINYHDDKRKESYLSDVININTTASGIKKWGDKTVLKLVLGNENAYYTSAVITNNAQWNRLRLASVFSKQLKKISLSAHQQVLNNAQKIYYTGGLSGKFKASEARQIGFSLNKVVRLPTLNELFWYQPGYALGNPDLKPEKGYKADLELRFNPYALSIKLNPFLGVFQNWINWSGYPEIKPENIQSVISRGFVLNVTYRKVIHRSTFALMSNVNWTKATYYFNNKTDARHGMQILFTPQLTSNLMLSFQRSNFGLHINEQFVSATFYTSDNSASLDPYFLTEAGGYYQLRQWRIGLLTSNMLNTSYYTQPRTPLPGRTLKININYTIPLKSWKEKY